jgi:DNA-binding protein Fis
MTNQSPSITENSSTSENKFDENPLKDKIGSSLKQLYNDVVNEDVPDDFLALLAKVDEQDK